MEQALLDYFCSLLMVFMVIFDYFDIASCAQFPEPIDENTQGSKFGYR